MSQEKIPIREFARRLKLSDTSVHKAIRTGKIVEGVFRDEQDKPWIIPEIALREWGKTFNPNYARKPELYSELEAATGSRPQPAPALEPQHDESAGNKSTAELKRLQTQIRVQREAIELKKIKGELVEKKKVYTALFAMGQEIRTTFQAIPDRSIDTILAARDRNEAHTVLTNAIAEALTQLADIVKRDIA